jgi:PPOX class probable F420-dependent enzyme
MDADEVRRFLTTGTRTAKVATAMSDGHPHVMPVWFVLDGDDIVFTTAASSAKGMHLRRDRRVALVIDDESEPYAFVHVRGRAALSDDPDELRRFATEIGGRYMGAERAEQYGRRNGVRGELLVRVTPERILARGGVAD